MAVKSISTRAQICGRGERCHGGHSAVEQSSYISRTTMHSEYDGQTYYPKYSEDLVYTAVMLPGNAPEEYKDPGKLWNAVETYETGAKAQLARTYRVELPNEWNYELATKVMRDYVQRNFVDKGMCAQFAIHDSENRKTGQRNLHCHILLTMRSLDAQGHWMAKQRKEYLKDENGERIPLMDKKTGQQKTDKQHRKQWKCVTIPTNDWSSKENAKRWRKDLADTINAVNQRIGMTEDFWEHRSFKEQGLEIVPQIHLGEKASAMERAGVQTIRGDINREIIANNAVIQMARAAYEQAKENLRVISAIPASAVKAIKSEILDMIREAAKRNHERLKLPIIKGKFLRLMSDRASLQNKSQMEDFVRKMGWTSFAEMKSFKHEQEQKYSAISTQRLDMQKRAVYLQSLLDAYREYEPYIKFHKEQWAVTGWARKKYERQHISELAFYDAHRSHIKGMITEANKKITPRTWRQELAAVQASLDRTQKPYAELVTNLSAVEVLEYNRDDLNRMLANESRQKKQIAARVQNRREEAL
ncbi:MobA/MobL family protein [Absicoccus porci]|uniref:MobA/MobL family protein n=1 Tax=Absicoccus porci TaxID=2486576 RepID=UPI002943908A|nr:MobA/MobL family protein [Absicoccus porci]